MARVYVFYYILYKKYIYSNISDLIKFDGFSYLNVLSVKSSHAKCNMKKRMACIHIIFLKMKQLIVYFIFFEVEDTRYIFLMLRWTRTNDSYNSYLFIGIARLSVKHSSFFFTWSYAYNSLITLVGIGPWAWKGRNTRWYNPYTWCMCWDSSIGSCQIS